MHALNKLDLPQHGPPKQFKELLQTFASLLKAGWYSDELPTESTGKTRLLARHQKQDLQKEGCR